MVETEGLLGEQCDVKRDMSLIKRILEFVDADNSPPRFHDGWTEGTEIKLEDAPIYDLSQHILMLGEAGYVELGKLEYDEIPRIARMTWKGYDLLDQLRISERAQLQTAIFCKMREDLE